MASEDPTQDIKEKYDTQPTIQTVIEIIGALGFEMRAGFAVISAWLDKLDVRVDRVASEVKELHSEFYTLRADL